MYFYISLLFFSITLCNKSTAHTYFVFVRRSTKEERIFTKKILALLKKRQKKKKKN